MKKSVSLASLAIIATSTTCDGFATLSATMSRHRGRSHNNNANQRPILPTTTLDISDPLFLSTITPQDINNNNSDKTVAPKKSKLEQLRQVSNIASILCVLDCTILPILTVALPLVGFIDIGAARMEFLHHLGHQLALYFVMPVGGLTGVVNYLSHKKSWITAMSVVGLVLIYLANAHSIPFVGHVHALHAFHHGVTHRVTNLVGCGFLLGSNYLSQKQGCAHSASCGHDHGHSHSHSHHDHHVVTEISNKTK